MTVCDRCGNPNARPASYSVRKPQVNAAVASITADLCPECIHWVEQSLVEVMERTQNIMTAYLMEKESPSCVEDGPNCVDNDPRFQG